jgi:hypothetical protein
MSPSPTPVLPVDAPPVPLSYAGHLGAADPRWLPIARWHIALAVLSGLTVLSCFAAMAWREPGAILHLLVCLATLAVGLRVGLGLGKLGLLSTPHIALDAIAGLGLLLLGTVPLLTMSAQGSGSDTWERPTSGYLALAFLCFGLTTFRHRLLYQLLATWSESADRPKAARGLRALGNIKMVYEALWLACCWLTLVAVTLKQTDDPIVFLALGALFGCIGYGILCIWMIVAHTKLAAALRSSVP